MEQKKQITKKGLFVKQLTFYIIGFICLFTPLIILSIVNFDKWFASNKDAFSVGAGGFLVAIFTVLLVKVGFKKLHKMVWFSFMLLIIFCLNSIIQDALVICFVSWIGVGLFSIFEVPAKHYKRLYLTWTDEEVRVEARKDKITNENVNNDENQETREEEQLEYGQI